MSAALENKEPATVGLVLMKSAEAQATVDYCADNDPTIRVTDRGTYYLLESEGDIRIPLDRVIDYLGRPMTMSQFLVVMSSYFGRVETADNQFLITPDMTQFDTPDEESVGS